MDSTIADSTADGDAMKTGDAPNGDSVDSAGHDGSGDAADGGLRDTGSDGSDGNASCGADNAHCTINGSQGLCKAGTCSRCTDTVDDDHCTTAYGSASRSYLCLAGVCTHGDCRTNGDCAGNPNGRFCGVSTPNLCGKCTSDQQCANGGAASVCDTATGRCVIGSCSSDAGAILGGGGAPAACPVNGSDICCTGTCQPGAGVNACCPGVNAATYCAAKIGNPLATCANNVCTACPHVLGSTPNYLVDPRGGSDQTGSGDGTTAGCAFKTITRALQVIGTPVLPTTITVLGPSTVMAGETFPIPLPGRVTLTTRGGAVQIDVPADSSGFALSGVDSKIDGTQLGGGGGPGLTVDGQNASATFGIVVDTGAGVTASNAPVVSNVVVTNFLDDGILVQNAGIVRIGPGITSTLNGTTVARKAGLHVTGTGRAIVDVASGAQPTHFDANTNHGILVDTDGSITLNGSVTDGIDGVGTVTSNRNFLAGVWIQQTPGSPITNSIDGLVSFGNTNGNGVRIVAGSNVKIRNSVALANQENGLIVSAGPSGPSNDISNIDLGTAVDAGGTFGGNTFQEPLGAGNNGAVGVCLDVLANAGTLRAAGNTFGPLRCATATGTLKLNAGACAACTGGVCDLGIINQTGNDIGVSMCTH